MNSPLWTTEITGAWGAPRKMRVISELNAMFYIDSWGVSLQKSEVRKFDLQTGRQVESFGAKSPIYGLDLDACDNFKVMINTSKKLFLLSSDLNELERFIDHVPSEMSHILKLGRMLAMRSNISDTVHFYDLDSMKVKRQRLGSGGPLRRDVAPNTALVCSGKDGIVWRVNVLSGETEKLVNDTQFDSVDIDYDSGFLWLSEGEPYVLEHGKNRKTIRPGMPTNRLRRVSLSDEGNSERLDVGFAFKTFSVGKQSRYIWIGRNEGQRVGSAPKSIHIFETTSPLQEVARFTLPDTQSFINHFDAKTGLVFSESEAKRGNDCSFNLHCWKMTV